jgi:alkaline phosphatase D
MLYSPPKQGTEMAGTSGLTRRGAAGAIGLATAAGCAQGIETPAYEGALTFSHGVASGDPAPDRVIIWTRVTPALAGVVPVRWIMARNPELTDVVRTGVFETDEGRDYTVKVDVTGLRRGAPYFYGFRAGDQQSAVGKTRTLPSGRLDQFRIAVASCASYPHGFFNAYEALAAREDVDLVLHLGDYIYEYGLSGYGGENAIALGRIPSPEIECVALQDYRQRHAQAKAEAELQAAHAIAPWIVVWDDHEVANDSWSGGAENHNPDAGEGEWASRKRAAMQAYYEWMPIRDPEPGRAFEAINRSFRFGDLFTLVMLESRLLARTKPLDYARDMPIEMQRWDVSTPAQPRPLTVNEPDAPAMRTLPALYEQIGDQLHPVLDWGRVESALRDPDHLPAGFHFAPDLVRLQAMLDAPDRVMLGEAQVQWLGQQLQASKEAGVAWQVLGNQVLMANILAPDLSATPPALAQALERLRPGVTKLLDLTRFPFPLNPDGWDGYANARTRVLELLRGNAANALVLTGDSHSAWANELDDARGRVAVEFGAPSITSPSDADYFTAAGIDFAAGVRARNPHIKWTDQTHRGFLVVTLTKERALAEFFSVSTVSTKTFDTVRAAAFTIAPTAGAGVGPITTTGD